MTNPVVAVFIIQYVKIDEEFGKALGVRRSALGFQF